MMPLRARLQSEDGATAVLFALVLPILLSLVGFGTEVLAMAGADRELQRTADQAALTAAAQIPLVDLGGVGGIADRNALLAALTPDADSPLADACQVATGNAQQSGLLTGFAERVPTCDNDGITITPVVTSPSLVTQTQRVLAALDDELTVTQSLDSQIRANLTAPGTTLDLNGSLGGTVGTPPPIATVFDTLASLGLPLELALLAPALTVSQMEATAAADVSTPLRTLISDDAHTPLAVDAVAQRRFKNVLLLPIIDMGCVPQPVELTDNVLALLDERVGSQALATLLIAYGLVEQNIPPLPLPDELPDPDVDPDPQPDVDPDPQPDVDPDPQPGVNLDPQPDVDPDPQPDVDPDPQPDPNPQPPPVPQPEDPPAIPEPVDPGGSGGSGGSGDGGDGSGDGTTTFQAAQLGPIELVEPPADGGPLDGVGDIVDDTTGTVGDLLEPVFQPFDGMIDGVVTDIDALLNRLVPGASLPVNPDGTLKDPVGYANPLTAALVGQAMGDIDTVLTTTGMAGQLGTGCEIDLNQVVTPLAVQRTDEVLGTLQTELRGLSGVLPAADELADLVADARTDLTDLLNPGGDAPTATEILRAAASADEDILVVAVGSTQIPALDFMIRPAREITALAQDPLGGPISASGEYRLDVEATMRHARVDTGGTIGVGTPDLTGIPSRVGSVLSTTTQARGLFRATLVD